jgi:hypothetical protein
MKSTVFAIRLAFAHVLGILIAGCTPAQSAILDKVEKVVLDDVTSGASVAVIEASVQALLPGVAGDAVDLAIQAAITLLTDEGLIPPSSTSNALSIQGTLATKLAARKLQ